MNLQHKKCAPFKQCLLFSDDGNLEKPRTNGKANKLSIDDKQFHDWYRFVLSFPPHLVREYINIFGLKTGNTILDPFCGTGTTVIEAKLCGINPLCPAAVPDPFRQRIPLDGKEGYGPKAYQVPWLKLWRDFHLATD